SACSPEIYRDEWLFGRSPNGESVGDGKGHVFICEPVHNLVHHEVIERDGVSFRSRRPASEGSSEFFASSDNWCRPVMVRTGPDGALWIADMYRQVIEHPEWIPQTAQRKLDLRGGSERGRIYRVVASDRPNRRFSRLDTLSALELVEQLHSANGWQRDMAQQLLLWRKAREAIPALEGTVKSAARPTARLHALATLDALGALRLPVLDAGLHDSHAGVRRHAVRLAEGAWKGGSSASGLAGSTATLVEHLLPMAEDPDPQVRQQVAYSLGSITLDASADGGSSITHRLGEALARIAARDAEDPYVTAAVLSSLNSWNLAAFTDAVLSRSTVEPGLARAAMAVASNSGERALANRLFRDCLHRLDGQKATQTRWGDLATVVESFQRNRGQLEQLDEATRRELSDLRERARQTAGEESRSSADRIAALRFLGVDGGRGSEDADFFQAFMTPQHAPELQQAAATALASRAAGQAAPLLLDGWRSHSPPLRTLILDLLLSSTRSTGALLDSLESGHVALADLDARRRQQLARLPDAALRQRAERLLGSATSSSRAQVVDQYQHVAELPADAGRGKVVFQKKCATCHRLEEAGQHVGPDLTTLTDKSPASLLTAILDPNRAVESKFLDYIAITLDGRQFTGMIQDETSSGVTLVGQEGKQVVLRRNELDVFESTGKSLMPEGLEKDIPEQELADVIAYVRSTSQPPKRFPGNQPELAHVRDDGSIRPLAMNARIFGTTLVFEERYRNLGEWRSSDDHAVWTLKVPQAGNYRVSVDYACAPPAAGNRFLLTVGSQTLGGTVESTGSWDEYRSQSVGRVTLDAGPTELTVRSDGAVRGALFDLRQIVLRPE
ncbi:MAG: c-type cytochrome, partial [Pirellulaceae bacterium]